jgi:hypothetical protein
MNKKKRTNNRTNNQPSTANKKPQKNILASAKINSGRDTEVLNEDLFNEPVLDKRGRADNLVRNEWILMFDEKQSFLKNLIALIHNSYSTSSILKYKTAFTLGDGFKVIETDTTPILQSIKKIIRAFTGDPKKLIELNNCLLSVNLDGETLEEVTNKLVYDYVAFGNAFAEIVKTTDGGNPVVYINHIPVYKCGISKPNKNGVSESIGISQDWQNQNKEDEVEVVPKYPKFTTGTVKRSVIHIKEYAVGFEFFGVPEWSSARVWAENEYRIGKHNRGKLKNGFVPSAFAQFFGAMTEEEAQDLIEGIDATFTDTGNNAKIFAQVLRDESYKMNLEILEDKSDGAFLELQTLASQAMITANRWTTSLSGIATSGKLGSNQQMRDEIEFVTNTVINPIRRVVLQKIINPFIDILSESKNNSFDKLKLEFVNLTPISLASMLDPNNILLNNEKREEFGFGKLTPEEEQKLATEQQNL